LGVLEDPAQERWLLTKPGPRKGQPRVCLGGCRGHVPASLRSFTTPPDAVTSVVTQLSEIDVKAHLNRELSPT